MTESPATGEGDPPSRVHHAIRQMLELTRRKPSPKIERAVLIGSFVAFVVFAVLAALNFPEVGDGIQWELLIPVGIVGMSLNLLFNAFEFEVIAHFVERPVSLARAVRVTVIGSAANLLPVPGSAVVRVQALASDGARYRHSVTAAATIGVMSIGGNLLLVGLSNAASAGAITLLLLFAGGATLVVIAVGMLRSAANSARALRFGVYMLGLEMAYSTVASVRLWLIFSALGVDVGLPAAFAISAVGSVANAVGFFPGALGIKEALTGLISPLVGVPVAVGVAGAVVQRLFGVAVLACAASILAATGRSKDEAPDLEELEMVDTHTT